MGMANRGKAFDQPNHHERRVANAKARRALTEDARKSPVSKRMNRPEKSDAQLLGYEFIRLFLSRFTVGVN